MKKRGPDSLAGLGIVLSNVILSLMILPQSSGAQTADVSEPAPRESVLLPRFAGDQFSIWSSPFHLQFSDWIWAAPALAAGGAFVASDSWLSRQVPTGAIAHSRTLSNYGVATLVGGAGSLFLWGKMAHRDHAAEAGYLATEAAVNAAMADFALKSIFRRQRPYDGNGAGRFFGGGSSFPSEHAAVSWAIAGVVAHEYPGPVTKLLSYGLATAVTIARVTGKEHFPSDVVVGGALGYFVAQQVYRRRRDPEVSTGSWGSLVETHPAAGEKVRSPQRMGSPDVPLDSWVYPAIERLAALGLVQTAYLGLRPWTRMECARLLEEAEDGIRYGGDGKDQGFRDTEARNSTSSDDAEELLQALQIEFDAESELRQGAENLGLSLDQVYTRFTAISGKPLRDGYHFGQTLVNDYGRPYAEGFNDVTGAEVSGVAGMLSFAIRGEYQHAPSVASDSAGTLQAIANEDGVVAATPDGSSTLNRFRIIEGTVGLTVNNLKMSFGKQSLWLGPGESGPLLFSNNAPPVTMLELDSASPFKLPFLSDFLGPVRMTSFLGQLSGQNWVYNPPASDGLNSAIDPGFLVGPNFHPQPFIHGNKISFHPTANLEFGMGVTAVFGGPGLPFTWHEFLRSYFGHNANLAENPAKRFSSFDFTYRIPGIRKWLSFYTDSMVGDEISPLGSTRPMLNPGIYLPQFPKLHRIELRAEGFKAEPRLGTIYIDRRYRSGYTNDGILMGSWIGRQALGGQAWAKYSFAPRSNFQLGYRHQEVDRYLAGGGRLTDFSAAAACSLGKHVELSSRAQYEVWNFPAIESGSVSNFTASLQLSVRPGLRWHKN